MIKHHEDMCLAMLCFMLTYAISCVGWKMFYQNDIFSIWVLFLSIFSASIVCKRMDEVYSEICPAFK